MTVKTAVRLAKEMAREFGAPYLPEGFVSVTSCVLPKTRGLRRTRTGGRVRSVIIPRRVLLSIRIGRRDADFDVISGRAVGAGTELWGAARQWRIMLNRGQK